MDFIQPTKVEQGHAAAQNAKHHGILSDAQLFAPRYDIFA
jgi:hypothetical protein